MMQSGSTGDAVYRRLKAALIAGVVEPVGRLDITQIADDFGVSPTPVREAAMRLLGEGLLEIDPRGGTRTLPISEFGLHSSLTFHGDLADMTLRLLGSAAIDVEAYRSDDQQTSYRLFFGALAQATGNTDLTTLFERYADRLALYRSVEPEILIDLAPEYGLLRNVAGSVGAAALRRHVRAYHKRRLAIVSQLAWHVARRGIARA